MKDFQNDRYPSKFRSVGYLMSVVATLGVQEIFIVLLVQERKEQSKDPEILAVEKVI